MWFKVCNSLCQHRKALEAGPEALGLWTLAGAWSCGQLTDGYVPAYVAHRLVANAEALASRLVQVGLWVEADGGYRFHDWEANQPSADSERETRRLRSEAGRKGGVRSGKSRREASAQAFAEPTAEASASASAQPDAEANEEARTNPDPDPDISPYGEIERREPERPDVEQLCQHLAERVRANGAKATIKKTWRDEARRLLDRDRRDFDEALALISWATSHRFWQSNILSVPKFREQYDRLRLQRMQDNRGRNGGHAPFQNPSDDSVYEEPLLPRQTA